MRLIDIKQSINIAKDNFFYNTTNTSNLYYITGIQGLKVSFNELMKIGLVDDETGFINEILTTASDNLSSDSKVFSDRVGILSHYYFMINKLYKWINEYVPTEETETTLNIKLPKVKEFKDLEKSCVQLKRALGQVVSEYGGELQIKQLDYGSEWIILDVKIVAAIPFIFYIIKRSIKAANDFYSMKLVREECRKHNIDNNFQEKQNEILIEIEKQKLSMISQDVDDKFFSDKAKDNERLKRIEESIKNLIAFLERGGEVYPSLIASEEIQKEVPNYKIESSEISGLIEEDNNKTEEE